MDTCAVEVWDGVDNWDTLSTTCTGETLYDAESGRHYTFRFRATDEAGNLARVLDAPGVGTEKTATTTPGAGLPCGARAVYTGCTATTASAGGVHILRVRAAETSIGGGELADQLVIAVHDPHSIALAASQQAVLGLDPVTLCDGGAPLGSAVSVPAHGGRHLSLVIRPH